MSLRILFVTQDDVLYVPHFFKEFAAVRDPDRPEVLGVVIQAPLGSSSLRLLAKKMVDFYGPWDFLRVGMLYAARTVLNAVAVGLFRGRFPGVFSVHHCALKEGWPVLPQRDVNSLEFLRLLEEVKPDLLVSVAASQKFKSGVLRAPRYGCINIHNALLPKNRGMLPNFWALYHHDTEPESGMTVHRMNEQLDDGPIILQERFRLNPVESLHRLIVRTKRMNAHLLLRALRLYTDAEPAGLPNDRDHATYNTFPTREDVHRYRAKGLRLL